MLVLTREREEVVMIGEDIRVTIIDIRGGKVRLGIEAPKEMAIHRFEVWMTIQNEKAEAAGKE